MIAKTKFLVIFLIAIIANAQVAVVFASDTIAAYGVNTVAGYSALLTTSATYPDRDVFFTVKKPDGSVLTIPAKTGSDGVARIDLYDYHTRIAGKYAVAAYPKDGTVNDSFNYFSVYPDQVSIYKSELKVERTVIKADGKDRAYIGVRVADQYGNPFPNHVVRLISSRTGDVILSSAKDIMTNLNGEISFAVSSSEPGYSIYTAVDATSGSVLAGRVEVAYLLGSTYMSDSGGHLNYFIPVASAQDAGPLNKFEIAGIPETVQPNTNISFNVTAQDQNGLTVRNYTGTVHFSVEGPGSLNVTLPDDYTFKAEDLGSHQFSLGLKFTESGSYKLIVTDVANTLIKGEKNVAVGLDATPVSGVAAKPVITMPVEGTYSQNVQTVSGTTQTLSTVKIFDNNQEIGMVQSDASGRFTFQTNPLAEGAHSIYVVLVDQTDTAISTSDTIDFFIDTTPPVVEDLIISPSSGIKAGDVVTLTVISEENLSDSAVVFNLDIYGLTPDQGVFGSYSTTFQAPLTAGEYPIDVLLIDELGNEAMYQSAAVLSIAENGVGVITGEIPAETDDSVTDTNQPPSQVFGVIAYGTDRRVTLVWEAATDDSLVDRYKIYFGEDPLNLNRVVETKDAATTWYIPDLENGREFFFAVSAVDDMGLESLYTSELVSAIPFTLEVQTVVPERPFEALSTEYGDAYLRGAAIESRAPYRMVENGPGLIWLLAGTGMFSGMVVKLSRRKKKV